MPGATDRARLVDDLDDDVLDVDVIAAGRALPSQEGLGRPVVVGDVASETRAHARTEPVFEHLATGEDPLQGCKLLAALLEQSHERFESGRQRIEEVGAKLVERRELRLEVVDVR